MFLSYFVCCVTSCIAGERHHAVWAEPKWSSRSSMDGGSWPGTINGWWFLARNHQWVAVPGQARKIFPGIENVSRPGKYFQARKIFPGLENISRPGKCLQAWKYFQACKYVQAWNTSRPENIFRAWKYFQAWTNFPGLEIFWARPKKESYRDPCDSI